ncbi:hypothetical protein [Bosea sp. 2RAB26]|uniref:hypothetical protein n=1 Tax=Bosea sp. 2RAB26 TaxID=3237476 RepID=UPI003F93991F
MAVYDYWWGTERPHLQEARYQRMADVFGQTARARLQAEFDAGMAEVDRITAASNQRVGLIRMSLVGGRYNREVANAVAAQHGLLGLGDPVKRGRGRPRKYGPDDTRPARPSRAKTDAGRLRAVGKQFPKRGRRNVDARVQSGTVSPVTASPARSVAPKAAAEIGRELLSGTIAAQQDVVAPIEVDVVVAEGALVAEPVAKPPSFDLAAIAARQQSSMELALRELSSEDDLSEDAILLRSMFLKSHKAQTQLHRTRLRGEAGVARLDYDFTDAMDETKAPPEVRERFTGFGLVTDPPSGEFSEEELQLWMKRAIFNGVDFPAKDFDRYLRDYKGAKQFYTSLKYHVDPVIDRERMRVLVWPSIERRLHFVEQTHGALARGKIDLDTAMVRVANFDFLELDTIRYGAHKIYREIVDAMRWFEGFSRLDIAEWSGHNPSKVPSSRSIYGFPGWTFPERLHAEIGNGNMLWEDVDADYVVPGMKELVEFASVDKEVMVANFRVRTDLDYADIDL